MNCIKLSFHVASKTADNIEFALVDYKISWFSGTQLKRYMRSYNVLGVCYFYLLLPLFLKSFHYIYGR